MTIFTTTPALSQKWVLEAQLTDLPKDVQAEVIKIWRDNDFGNDVYYFSWAADWCDESYPIIAKYLAERNVTECLIHYWW
jgi:hypothetical protein